MKKIALISAIALSGLFYNSANAQVRIGFGIRINTPAVRVVAEAPAPVYTEYAPAEDYYYLPEIDAYYSVPEQCYYYNNGYNWVSAAYLPGEYRNYDWRSVRHYEVRARRPYLNADVYRARYRGRTYDWRPYMNDRRFDDRRFDDHRRFDDRPMANRDFRRDDRRDDQPVFERRNDYRGSAHAGSRGWDNTNRRDDRGQDGNYNRPTPPQQPQNNGGGRGDNGRPDWNQNQNQPSRGDGGRQRGNGNDDHFVDNHGQNGGRVGYKS